MTVIVYQNQQHMHWLYINSTLCYHTKLTISLSKISNYKIRDVKVDVVKKNTALTSCDSFCCSRCMCCVAVVTC